MVAIKNIELTKKKLKKVLSYNKRTGDFIWIGSAWNKKFREGKIAGYIRGGTYRVIKIDGVNYLAHRLAWLYVTGKWSKELDHINGVKFDNRWQNLREATVSQNQANRGKPKIGSLPKGVKKTKYGKYEANITVNGKYIYLGIFPTPQKAHIAYTCAAYKFFGEFACREQ